MSTALADPRRYAPAPPREQAPEPRLRALGRPQRRKRPKLVYAVTAIAGAALVAAGQIALTLAITQDSFVLAGLRVEQRELALQVDVVASQLSGLTSPQHLAASADALGMVGGATPAYLRLSDGELFGKGKTATAGTASAGIVGNSLVSTTQSTTPPDEAAVETVVAEPDPEPRTVVTVVSHTSSPPPTTGGLPSPSTH